MLSGFIQTCCLFWDWDLGVKSLLLAKSMYKHKAIIDLEYADLDLSSQSSTKYFGKDYEKQSYTRAKSLDICFCMFFECQCQEFISAGKTEH